MKYKVTFSNVQFVDNVRSINGAIQKAKKNIKPKLGDKIYQEIITDISCRKLK